MSPDAMDFDLFDSRKASFGERTDRTYFDELSEVESGHGRQIKASLKDVVILYS